MFIESKILNKISLGFILIFIVYLSYIFIPTFFFVKDHHVGLDKSKYVHKVTTKPYIRLLADHLTKGCTSKLCEAQKILNYVTNIEYKVNNWITMSPKKTIEVGYGDCDDKSNLLISLLKVKGFDSYFVLVPGHIFVVTSVLDSRLHNIRGLYLDGKKYYILESTAKNSRVGFPLKYKIGEIEAIIEPFENEKIDVRKIEYKK
jgi:transglutaminase-like putative cysteine protease